ncbi:hypothetical protein JCM10212_000047 [Sporobolomyces blumeae]
MADDAVAKKPRRGRRQDDSLPPSRSRDVQRAFRARRAAHLSNLEAQVTWLVAENKALRQRCGLPEDGDPLTGPAPEMLVVEGPADQATPPAPKAKGGKANAKQAPVGKEPRSSSSVEPAVVPRSTNGQAEAIDAAEVLLAGSTGTTPHRMVPAQAPLQQESQPSSLPLPLQPSSTSPRLHRTSLPSPALPPRLPETSSDRRSSYPSPASTFSRSPFSPLLQSSAFSQPSPHHAPMPNPNSYLSPNLHSTASHPIVSPAVYAPSYPQPSTAVPTFPLPSAMYPSYYPSQPSPRPYLPPAHSTSPFATTMPSPTPHHQAYSPHRRDSHPSNPPSSHLRVQTFPDPAPPPLTASPSSFPFHQPSPPVSYPPPTQPVHLASQVLPPPMDPKTSSTPPVDFMTLFPTPSPEDEQFFLDTFCGIESGNPFLESLFDDFGSLVPGSAVLSTSAPPPGTDSADPEASRIDRPSGETKPVGEAKHRQENNDEYKAFCIGLMKGVKGIEGLIAQKKRKRDPNATGGDDGRRADAKRVKTDEERKEQEQDAVAFLAAAAYASKRASSCGGAKIQGAEGADEDCCDGLISCDPASTPLASSSRTGSIGSRTSTSPTTTECCDNLISCGPKSTSVSTLSERLASEPPLPPPLATIYLPRPRPIPPPTAKTQIVPASSSCCGPNTSCTIPAVESPPSTSSSPPHHDAYIRVSHAFAILSPYFDRNVGSAASSSTNRAAARGPDGSGRADGESSLRSIMNRSPPPLSNEAHRGRSRDPERGGGTSTRIAEMLYNASSSSSSTSSCGSTRIALSGMRDVGQDDGSTNDPANLIIVPPTKEEEDRGRKGELYVRKEAVEAVRARLDRLGNE